VQKIKKEEKKFKKDGFAVFLRSSAASIFEKPLPECYHISGHLK